MSTETQTPVFDVYPSSQEEARRAFGWRDHVGTVCPADCDEIYYRRTGFPDEALGPTPPLMLRWSRLGDGGDIASWHPVFSADQMRHRLSRAPLSTACACNPDNPSNPDEHDISCRHAVPVACAKDSSPC